MTGSIGGQRPRPRVALLGNFEAKDIEHFKRMFPTIWQAPGMSVLKSLVNVSEIDLLIIAPKIVEVSDWPERTHVICFSKSVKRLPGPLPNTYVKIPANAETEEFLFPDVPLPISRRREADYSNLASVRGWPRLCLWYTIVEKADLKTANIIFNSGAIICEHQTNLPLAVYFLRKDSGLGVSWLPSVDTNKAAWVDLLVTQWAQSDKEAFSSFGDWIDSPEWMVAEEEQILSQIKTLEQKKQESIIEIDKQIGELTIKLNLAKANANKGQRRLVTAQGPGLVDEVVKTLKCIGFNVTLTDELVGENEPKREDLRLGHSGKGGEMWNAIAEVRGYKRSGGTTSDLGRLNRFAELYRKETGQTPDKRIYIVNGQLELLLPPQRQEPLSSATEDLQIFSETDGILIWSVDLFRAIKATNPSDYPALLESIKCAQGRWVPFDVLSPKDN